MSVLLRRISKALYHQVPTVYFCCCLIAKQCPNLLRHHGLYPARFLCPWDFPGKNTGVGGHFLPSPGDSANSGIKPAHFLCFLNWQAGVWFFVFCFFTTKPLGKPMKIYSFQYSKSSNSNQPSSGKEQGKYSPLMLFSPRFPLQHLYNQNILYPCHHTPRSNQPQSTNSFFMIMVNSFLYLCTSLYCKRSTASFYYFYNQKKTKY